MRQLLHILFILLLTIPARAQQRPELVPQAGHTGNTSSVAFSPDGRILASGSHDRTIKLWDTSSGAILRTLTGTENEVWRVTFSADGKLLASGSGNPNGSDFSIRLWDVDSGNQVAQLLGHRQGVTSLSFSPDGRKMLSGSCDGTVRLWDLTSRKTLKLLPGHMYDYREAAFRPDGKVFASGGRETSIELWDTVSGHRLRQLPDSTRLGALIFSRDGKLILGGQDEHGQRSILVWDASSGRLIHTLSGHTDGIIGLALSPNGKTLASVSVAETILWDAATFKRLAILRGNTFAAFSPDNRRLATSDAGDSHVKLGGEIDVEVGSPNIVLWDVVSHKVQRRLTGYAREEQATPILAYGIAASADGHYLARRVASAAGAASIKVWDLTSSAGPLDLPGIGGMDGLVAFSPDSHTLAVSNVDQIGMLDVAARNIRWLKVPGYTSADALEFSPDGTQIAMGNDEQVTILDVKTGAVVKQIRGRGIAWEPRGNGLATCGTLDQPDVQALSFSPDGKLLAAASGAGEVMIWDAATRKPLQKFQAGGNITTVRFSADGHTLACSGSDDDAIYLWDVEAARPAATLGRPASRSVSSDGRTPFVFLPGNKYLARGLRHVRIWNYHSGEEVATLTGMRGDDWMVVTPDGLFDGSPRAWDEFLWRLGPHLHDLMPPQAYFSEFYAPGLLPDLLSGNKPALPTPLATRDRRLPHVTLTVSKNDRLCPVQVHLATTGSGVRDVRLFRNGSLVKAWRGLIQMDSNGHATLETKVTLPDGDNFLTAYAFNCDNVKSADAALTVKSRVVKHTGITYILSIGINQYSDAAYHLDYAAADARDFSEEVKKRQAVFGEVEVTQLLDSDATRENIFGALERVAAIAEPEDTLFIFFAGHGMRQGKRFMLLPHDLGNGISDEELASALETIDTGKMLLVMDACYSGQALEADERRLGPLNAAGLAHLAYEKGMYVLAAAQSYQTASELTQFGHGLLTYALVDKGLHQGLADNAPKDGWITLREWLNYASAEVPTLQGGNRPRLIQRPRLFYRREPEEVPFVIARLLE